MVSFRHHFFSSITIQIQWKVHLAYTMILTEWLLHNFAHDATVVPCAKLCCNLMASNWINTRLSLHGMWTVSKKDKEMDPLVAWKYPTPCPLHIIVKCRRHCSGSMFPEGFYWQMTLYLGGGVSSGQVFRACFHLAFDIMWARSETLGVITWRKWTWWLKRNQLIADLLSLLQPV